MFRGRAGDQGQRPGGTPGARTVLGWMGGQGEVLENAALFAEVIFGGCIITFTGGMLDSVLRVWKATKAFMVLSISPGLMPASALEIAGSVLAGWMGTPALSRSRAAWASRTAPSETVGCKIAAASSTNTAVPGKRSHDIFGVSPFGAFVRRPGDIVTETSGSAGAFG